MDAKKSREKEYVGVRYTDTDRFDEMVMIDGPKQRVGHPFTTCYDLHAAFENYSCMRATTDRSHRTNDERRECAKASHRHIVNVTKNREGVESFFNMPLNSARFICEMAKWRGRWDRPVAIFFHRGNGILRR